MEGAGPSTMGKSNEEDDYDHNDGVLELPPGFRFHPTDEEIITHYLLNKVINNLFVATAIAQADFNKSEPWDLPKMAKMGENEWFFFCQRDRKYPTGMRTNRATESGYWKATGKDREIYMKSKNKCLVGMKKTLVFYKGRAPKGEKTNWVMHEYRLEGNFSSYNFSRAAKDSWVVCKVFHKNIVTKRSPGVELARMDSFVDHLLCSPTSTALPPLADYSTFATDESEFMLRNSEPNPVLFPQISHYQSSNIGSYQYQQDPINFPFYNEVNLGVREPERMCKIENDVSCNNSVVSHSQQDTGISNEITSVHFEGDINNIECKKPFEDDHHEIYNDEGLAFSPNMSDFNSLWRY
ncbi:hypothetical protein ACJIZ3_020599 [Penstemon smallii]|uniref:NAC domain-containing protein n=1 Tax=Penstemon smallii TaxID=265156 RepID=A0ABD3SJ19_9LAMI